MIAELTEVAQYDEVAALFGEIWATDVAASPVPAELMCALRLTGNYVAGAYFGGELVGAAVGFFDSAGGLHSHVVGVRASWQGRGVGLALKLHQRDWALERGIEVIHWTFDPLVRRNAHFTLVKLGTRPVRYLPNFYGPLPDGDRFLVEWPLTASSAPALLGAVQPLLDASLVLSGSPTSASVTVAIPPDVEALRIDDPVLPGKALCASSGPRWFQRRVDLTWAPCACPWALQGHGIEHPALAGSVWHAHPR